MSGEPGAANIDVGVARIAALNENAQRVLEGSSQVHSQEQAARFQFGRQAREAVVVSPKPLKTLSTLAERFGKQPDQSTEIPSRQIAEQRDSSIVFRSGDASLVDQENARAFTIQTAGIVARHIVENGSLEGINPAVLVDLRTTMIDLIPEIADVPMSDPRMLELFASANITDPDVLQAIVRKYKEIQSREVPEDIRLVQEAKAKTDKSFQEADARQKKLSEEQKRLADRQASLDPENDEADSDNQKLIALRATRPDDRMGRTLGDINRAEKRLVEAKKRYEANPSDAAVETEMKTAEEEANRLIGAREEIQREIDTIRSLTEERAKVERVIPKNADELRSAEETLQVAKDRLNVADVALTDARGRRVDFEVDYTNDYRNLIRDSIIEVNDRRAQQINERLIKEVERSGNEMDQFMAARIAARYTKILPAGTLISERSGRFGFFRRTKTVEAIVDTERARTDVEVHMLAKGGKGPVEILRQELVNAYGKTNPRVAELMSDHDFVTRWSVEYGLAALRTYQQNGGKLNDGQIRFIAAQGLGAEMIKRLQSKPEVLAAEAEMKKNGELPPGGFKDVLSTEEGRKKYLALIFKIAAGILAPAAAVALSEGTGKR